MKTNEWRMAGHVGRQMHIQHEDLNKGRSELNEKVTNPCGHSPEH